MLGPGRLQLPHNAMTKLGQDVVHFSHHSPSPSSSPLRTSERVLELTPHAVTLLSSAVRYDHELFLPRRRPLG
jgi:hypothetical protein